jgi:pyruvate ferredoxin oxidoreductase alpha subunit
VSAPQLLTGGEAVAHAMRQIDPDVVPVYPITPQTPIVQTFSHFIAAGRAHGELVDVESEHSAMSAAIGAALAGARTMTATSSQGLALMAEVVYIAASMRAPLTMAIGNRALSGPINIHCDHSDSMLIRDSGIVQLFAENAQEAYDLMVVAPRLAEHPDVLLPVAVCLDGFTTTHAAEPVSLLHDEAVRAFVGEYRLPHAVLDVLEPATHGPFAMPDYYYELRRQQAAALVAAL